MKITKKAVIGIVAGTVAAGSLGFGSYAGAMNKDVTLHVDGQAQEVTVWGTDVQDLLDAQNITLSDKDEVTPAADASISDGSTATIKYARQLTVITDGIEQVYWTSATTVADALTEIGLHDPETRLSVDRSTPLGREGLTVTATTPKEIHITVDGQTIDGRSSASTVAELLSDKGIALGADDRVNPGADTAVSAGLAITVQRVAVSEETTTQSVDYQTVSTEDSSLT